MYGGASHRLAPFFSYWRLSLKNAKTQKDMLIYDICLLLKGKSFGSEFGGAIDNNK